MSAAQLVQIGGAHSTPSLIPTEDATRWKSLHPRFAHLYVENKCNLKCQHCYEDEETHPTHVRVTLDDYSKILDGLASIGVLVVTFSGGEPFLRRDFLDLVELARKKRFAVRIYTSGTLIDERKADRLQQLGVSEVHISLYSHEAEVHDRFTQVPGSHARSVRAIRLLKERGIVTIMKANVMTFNIDHLDELVGLAAELESPIQLSPEVYRRNSGDPAPQEYLCSAEELSKKYFSRPDLYALAGESDNPGECVGDGHWTPDSGLCAVARRLVTVGADGSLYPCAMFPVSAGNTLEQGVADVWYRSPLLDKIRKTTFGQMTECPTCDVRADCHPCMAYGYAEHGDHRACNSTSRNTAEAVALTKANRRDAQRKMRAGKALPLVGERHAPAPKNPYVSTHIPEVVR